MLHACVTHYPAVCVSATNPSASVDDDAIYENVQLLNQYDDDEWDSSEFESFEDTEIFNDEER